MVKNRGEGSQGDRICPTTSVRRRRRHVNEDEENVKHEDAEHVEPEEAEPQMEVEDACTRRHWTVAARTYLLHPVG